LGLEHINLLNISIGIGDAPGEYAFILEKEPQIWFRDESIFCCMEPYFRILAEKTGQIIGYWDYARFEDSNIDALISVLSSSLTDLEAKPDNWSVSTYPNKPFKIFEVDKRNLRDFIGQFLVIANRAVELNLPVLCIGD
jgi:hypothetical protein